MADHDAAMHEPIDQQQDAVEDPAAAAVAADAAAAAAGAAGQQQTAADMEALAAAASGLNLEAPLTPKEEEELDVLCKLLEAAGQTMPCTMLVQSYRSDSTLVRSHVLSVCTKSLSIMGPQGSGKDSLFKDLSK
jgi:ATPase subunit of ABC transporter with duplicated ATPase domains